MNKIFPVYLFLLGLIIYVHAADVMVNVGNAKGENIFEPAKILALPGDNIVFTWVSGKHSVIEADSLTACAMSAKPNAGSSLGAYSAPNTWVYPISRNAAAKVAGETRGQATLAAAGKTWFYCGVPGHCTPGIGGMVGTLVIAL
ncbi:unnamed protein product [Rhizophagus irregularis]|nr:unnamed protein product [Rhizophagus irregularis]